MVVFSVGVKLYICLDEGLAGSFPAAKCISIFMHLNLEIWPEYLSISMYVLDVALCLPLHLVGHQFNYINCWLCVWFDCFLVAIYSYCIVVLGGLCREEKPLFTRWVPVVEIVTSLSTRGSHLVIIGFSSLLNSLYTLTLSGNPAWASTWGWAQMTQQIGHSLFFFFYLRNNIY